jgi:hypothetical protein
MEPEELLRWFSDDPSVKMAVAAFRLVLRGRPAPVLFRKDYRQHRVPTLGAFESDVISVGIAESTVAALTN